MNTTPRQPRDNSNEAKPKVPVIDGAPFGFAVAEYLTENAQSVTFVSEDQPTDVADEVKLIHRKLSNTTNIQSLESEVTDVDLIVAIAGSDSQGLPYGYITRRKFEPCDVGAGISNPANSSAFEDTGVDCLDMPRTLAEQICDRYT